MARCSTWRGGAPAARSTGSRKDDQGRVFLDHGGIWLLELSKFAADAVETEQQRWLKFFTEAERLDADARPAWMQTQEMRRAMNTLKTFSEKEQAPSASWRPRPRVHGRTVRHGPPVRSAPHRRTPPGRVRQFQGQFTKFPERSSIGEEKKPTDSPGLRPQQRHGKTSQFGGGEGN